MAFPGGVISDVSSRNAAYLTLGHLATVRELLGLVCLTVHKVRYEHLILLSSLCFIDVGEWWEEKVNKKKNHRLGSISYLQFSAFFTPSSSLVAEPTIYLFLNEAI